jgi:hypothetical protein
MLHNHSHTSYPLTYEDGKKQSVPKHWHLNYRCRVITKKRAYEICTLYLGRMSIKNNAEPRSLVGISKHFIGKLCLCFQDKSIQYCTSSIKMEKVGLSETLVHFFHTTSMTSVRISNLTTNVLFYRSTFIAIRTTVVTLLWCGNDCKTYSWTH